MCTDSYAKTMNARTCGHLNSSKTIIELLLEMNNAFRFTEVPLLRVELRILFYFDQFSSIVCCDVGDRTMEGSAWLERNVMLVKVFKMIASAQES
jgi:hypothetical protein